jgi:hypothetical protein
MVRIPSSYNSKYVQRNMGTKNELGEVKIIQKWDYVRPKIRMLDDFYIYLADQKIKELQETQQWKEREKKQWQSNNVPNTTAWIERLLQTSMEEHRKFAVWMVLPQYLSMLENYHMNKLATLSTSGWTSAAN